MSAKRTIAPKRIATTDLQKATQRAVKALIAKRLTSFPGVLTGFVLGDDDLSTLGEPAESLAREVAKSVKASSGVAVRADVVQLPTGGVLIGYVPTAKPASV